MMKVNFLFAHSVYSAVSGRNFICVLPVIHPRNNRSPNAVICTKTDTRPTAMQAQRWCGVRRRVWQADVPTGCMTDVDLGA
jgi:hypothetical protein